jgi:hypothetical protein
VSEPKSARQSTVHEQGEEEAAHARAWRAHTRGSLPEAPSNVVDITERSRARIAERWGKPIEEPPTDASFDPENEPSRLQDVANQMHFWRDPSPSLRAVWHDLTDGGRKVYDDGGFALTAGYWLLGIPGFGLVAVAKVVETIGARPGRMAGFMLIALLVWGALLKAGINPIPIP